MKTVRRICTLWAAVLIGSCMHAGTAWSATSWALTVRTASSGETYAQSLPVAPTGITATCAAPTTSKTIRVGWTAAIHATSYTIYRATTSANGTYTQVATGISGTSWTSGSLTSATNYWYEVVTKVGSNWISVRSAASAESTINATSPFCIQP